MIQNERGEIGKKEKPSILLLFFRKKVFRKCHEGE
jgi:hypothetical protein